MPSRMPSSSARRQTSRSTRNSPLLASSVTGASTASRHVVGHAGEQAADALHDERTEGRDERTPQQPQHQQPAGLRLVAVQPEVAEHQRDHRERGQHRSPAPAIAGAPESAMISSIGSAPRQTRTIATTVNAAAVSTGCGHGGEPRRRRAARRSLRRTVTSVSEDTAESTTESGERGHEDRTRAALESHDPPSPRPTPRSCAPAGATASSRCPGTRSAERAAVRRTTLAEMFPGERLVLPAGDVQGALQRHRLPVPPRHRAHLLLRQPDQRRGAGDRGRRGRALRPAPLRPRDRRVLPRPPVRRAVGRPAPVAARDRRTRSASSAATSTELQDTLTATGGPRPASCAASPPTSTA